MNIKRDDMVKVLSGKDKGKKGKVLQVFPAQELVVVEGVNAMYKHMKSGRAGEAGQKIEFNGPVNASNVQRICPKCGKPSRSGYKVVDDKKVRVCKKCGEVA